MTEKLDIRWKQRFENYLKALKQLEDGVSLVKQRVPTNIEKQGIIKAFEFTHELGWNVMKDYLEYQGISNLIGSRDAIRESFRVGLVDDGEVWMAMIKSRNLSSQTYHEATADSIIQQIVNSYQDALRKFADKLQEYAHDGH